VISSGKRWREEGRITWMMGNSTTLCKKVVVVVVVEEEEEEGRGGEWHLNVE